MVPIILGFSDWMKEDKATQMADSLLKYYFQQDQGDINHVEELLDVS